MIFLFLGSHPGLSHFEVKTVFSDVSDFTLTSHAIGFDYNEKKFTSKFNMLGGIPKAGNLIGTIKAEANDIQRELSVIIAKYMQAENIRDYVISSYVKKQFHNKREIHKEVKEFYSRAKYSGRFEEGYTSPASVYYLYRRQGAEFNLIELNEQEYGVILTTFMQDPNYWSTIDFEKPFRDKHIGMLPSKLARIMVNLTGAARDDVIWDPFVGQGTVLMQALITDRNGIGSDISIKAIEASKENLTWLLKRGFTNRQLPELIEFDIKKEYGTISYSVRNVSYVVTEPFLGNFRSKPFESKAAASQQWGEIYRLYNALLEKAHDTIKRKGRVVFVKPLFQYIDNGTRKWYNPEVKFDRLGFKRIKISEKLEDNSWIQKDNTIAREIVVLEK